MFTVIIPQLGRLLSTLATELGFIAPTTHGEASCQDDCISSYIAHTFGSSYGSTCGFGDKSEVGLQL